ncbi:AbiH family protein [Fusobacterium sp. IOR10]|uniref:AbiH family protein n=1 Tax=Fusobacterium sp. IOR10 TaxID=2665157 RepID=UPI0013D1E8B8|nr:AbiH family protein [Fusobacterium sp. IOR10]
MSKLFITGNGFDLRHRLETSYNDFKIFLIIQILKEKYRKEELNFLEEFCNYCDDYLTNYSPNEKILKSEITLILEDDSIEKISMVMKKIIEEYFFDSYPKEDIDMYFQEYLENESNWSKYFINLIEVVYSWQEFESSLGKIYLEVVNNYSNPFKSLDYNEANRILDQNREVQSEIFEMLEDLHISFRNWIGLVDVNKANKFKDLEERTNEETLFLTFNYTNLLEEIYNVKLNNILHIHGKVGEKIIYGHEGFELLSEKDEYLKECELIQTTNGEAIYELDEKLRKKTEKIIKRKKVKDFFEKFKNVDEIYSYGFSYGKVDQVYIEEIIKKVNGKDVTWYLNDYNHKENLNYIELIKKIGFEGEIKEFSCN